MADEVERQAERASTKRHKTAQSSTPSQVNETSKASDTNAPKRGRPSGRPNRPFPAVAFDEAFTFAKEVYEFGSGQPVRRLSLFDHLQRMPDSGPSRQLITNANKYNLVKGNYTSEYLELTPEGKRACDESTTPRERARTKAKLAITDIEPFNSVYQKFLNAKLPARAALIDTLKEAGVGLEHVEEGADTFIVNMKATGLLQTLSGAERVVTIEHLLDTLPGAQLAAARVGEEPPVAAPHQGLITQEQATFENTCFYVTPIGGDETEARKHSDLFLSNLVEPAMRTLSLNVVRADQIDKPGVITRQIIEYLLRSRLVIADLSFSNANVFYELALRHAARLPAVQIVRYGDPIPFDINQMRTIIIDNRDIYTLLPNVELYRSDIATQARRALEAGAEVDTPISIYFPQARLTF